MFLAIYFASRLQVNNNFNRRLINDVKPYMKKRSDHYMEHSWKCKRKRFLNNF